MQSFKSFLDEGVNDPAIFKAIFLAGGPGSGKSFIVGKTGLTSMGYKVVNSDDAFEAAMKKVDMDMTPETSSHRRVKNFVVRQRNLLVRKKNVI